MKDKIICLVGPSGTGKTTIAKELEKKGYNIIHSFTTREPRESNEWGHIFLEKSWIKEIADNNVILYRNILGNEVFRMGDMIAHFNDYGKDEIYFATYEQYQGKGTSIYIVDPDGANQVKENVKDAEVVTIFLMAEEDVRFDRMVRRVTGVKEYPIYHLKIGQHEELLSRLDKDKEIFKTCKCNYVIDANRELEEVVKDVTEIIEGEI